MGEGTPQSSITRTLATRPGLLANRTRVGREVDSEPAKHCAGKERAEISPFGPSLGRMDVVDVSTEYPREQRREEA